jgi:hypothetical protein
MLSGMFHSNCLAVLDTLILTTIRLPELELGLTAGVAGRQGMLTPLRHLIPPPVYLEVRVCHILKFCISYRTCEIDDCSLFMLFPSGQLTIPL